MKGIVAEANQWCMNRMIKSEMARGMMLQLEKYDAALAYLNGNESISALASGNDVTDLAQCS